jgi:hypothetical protein
MDFIKKPASELLPMLCHQTVNKYLTKERQHPNTYMIDFLAHLLLNDYIGEEWIAPSPAVHVLRITLKPHNNRAV